MERVRHGVESGFVDAMGAAFRRLWDWGWNTATRDLAGALRLGSVREGVGTRYDFGAPRDRAALKKLLFAPPSKDKVRAILHSTTAPDAIPWDQRIKTVSHRELGQLSRELSVGYSTGANIDQQTKTIRHHVDNLEWMARRIARTEGVRIAEASLRETWDRAGDLIAGVQWFSALSKWTRAAHAARHLTIYVRQSDGSFVAEEGEFAGKELPTVPLGPNCLCWTSPVLAV
jgi:hypothetical protein